MSKKISTEEVINMFRSVHGDKYDYSKVDYKKMHEDVTIICPKHGEFQQPPHSHLRGQGCKYCGIESRAAKRKYDNIEFIDRAKKIHGNKYDYSKVEYVSSKEDVVIICPKHGEFKQSPNSHLQGQGCPFCKGEKSRELNSYKLDDWIIRANEIHGSKYDYSKVDLLNRDEKGRVCIICPRHGEFWQDPVSHLQGRGCKKCGIEASHKPKYTLDTFIEASKKIHGDKYDYSKTVYNGILEEVIITCPKHGDFLQVAENHLQGNGCRKCGYEKVSEQLLGTRDEFIEKVNKIYGGIYDYSKVEYINNKEDVIVICPKHGEFKVRPDNHLTGRNGCPQCSTSHSIWEKEVFKFISEELGIESILGDKIMLDGKELDIFVPSKMIAFECNGLRWHSEEFKDKNYHLDKTNRCHEKGIRLIHIFEDEWIDKNDIVKGRIKSILGVNDNIIYARKCKIRGISENKAKGFLERNHIQGYVAAKYSYGLYYGGKLVSVASFGYNRVNLGGKKIPRSYELLRLCSENGYTIIGGASRLLKFFIDRKNPKKIISYCDLRWSDGNVYEKMGFKLSHISRPNYFYVVNNKRKNRFNYRKSELISEGYDSNKTEHEIMLDRGIYRIYDCGCKVYKMEIGF